MKRGIGSYVLELLLEAGVIMIVAYFFDSVYVKDFLTAFLVAIVLSLLNTFIKPILSLIAFPITILSLGLFQLVINGFVLSCATYLLRPDFYIEGFFMTIVTSIVISILNSLLGITYE